MSATWDEDQFLQKLIAAVDCFDRDGAAKLCNELIAVLHEGAEPSPKGARKILQTLRRKCYFDLMERVAEALLLLDIDENQIRRQYAQSLIDQGKARQAISALESLIPRTTNDPVENAEARGLLGRVYKQLYVNEVNSNPGAKGLRLSQLNLQRALSAYREVYELGPDAHLWHGINTVALVMRAKQDAIKLDPEPNATAIAQEILDLVNKRKDQGRIDYWDMATAAEASVAIGNTAQALAWIGEYVQQPAVDAFELSSTERQLREVWGLTIDRPPGSLLLPLLQSQLLQCRGGRVDLAAGTLATTIDETEKRASDKHLEKILGSGGIVTLQWYLQGLERCRAVAQIRTSTDEGFGSGFLIRGGDLAPALGDELLLLTNAHVISDDPAVQASEGALPSEDATIVFEALPSAANKKFQIAKLLWTSPPGEFDATLVQLEPKITDLDSYPISKALPLCDGKQRVYVIGHPGGRSLSLSLHDNLLLDHDKRLIHYRTPTEGGSSGSPVFNQQWKLIGLHHAGDHEMQRLNGKPGTYQANEGVWIQAIKDALSNKLAGNAAGQ